MSSVCSAGQERPRKSKVNRTLSDITNITAQSLGKRPLLESKNSARLTKIGSGSSLSIFDDGVQPTATQSCSPSRSQTKSNSTEQDVRSCKSHQLLDMKEMNATELPPIQDFADRVSDQEQYRHAMGLDDGPDGFGRPADLARTLAHGPAEANLEMEAVSDLWSHDFGQCSVSCPDSAELNRMAWQSTSMSPSPKCKAFGLSTGSSPLFPPIDVEMDIDSDSEGDYDRHVCMEDIAMI